MLEPDVTTALAQLQKRTGSDKMSLFEHLTSLVAEVLETRGEEVDVLHLSELVKKQALTAPRSDGIPQALSTEDVQEIRRILQLYGCGTMLCQPPSSCIRAVSVAASSCTMLLAMH